MTEPIARESFICRAVLPRAIAVDVAAEDHVNEGDVLRATASDGRVGLVGRVVAIRQHRVRAEWSVLELDRDAPKIGLRGCACVAEAVGE